MDSINIFLALLFLVIIAISFLFYISAGTKRRFRCEVLKGLERTSTLEKSILTEDDIKHLPELVQKYLAYVGVIGKEKVYNIEMICDTEINLGPENGWTRMKTIEYNFYDKNPARLAFMKFKLKGLPVIGLDSYVNKKGNMLMKPAGLFTVVNAKGHDMDDTSAAVMLFVSMCTGAPAALIDDRIQWTTVDDSTVRALFNNNGCKVTAILKFDDMGELIEFSTEDKYYSPTGKSYQKVKWSTPVLNYNSINGLRLPTYGEAIWHFPEGDFCYGKNTLQEIKYNCKIFHSIG